MQIKKISWFLFFQELLNLRPEKIKFSECALHVYIVFSVDGRKVSHRRTATLVCCNNMLVRWSSRFSV